MTKKEMVYEILSKTKLTGVDPKEVEAKIKRNNKGKIQNAFDRVERNKGAFQSARALCEYQQL